MTSGKVQTREGDPNVKLVDRVFEHEMRKAIKESDSAYAKENGLCNNLLGRTYQVSMSSLK